MVKMAVKYNAVINLSHKEKTCSNLLVVHSLITF